MKRFAGLVLLTLLAASSAPRAVTVVRTGRIHTGTGEVLERGMIVIEDGRISALRPYGEIPAGATLIEAEGETVIPGMIDAFTALADDGRDADETVAPEILAIDGFDFYTPAWRLLAGGVTTVGLSPGSRRLVSGQGAVVKTAGRLPEARVLRERMGLRVSLGETSKNPPPLYSPPIPASAEHPIKPVRRQYPSSRMGEFAALRASAASLRALKQPLFIQAHGEDDLVKAALFAQEIGVPLVLVDAEEAPRVAGFLAQRKIPVILNSGAVPGRRDIDDETRPGLVPAGNPEGAAELVKAGVAVALQASRDGDLRDLLFVAAAAVRHGMSEKDALAAVTRVPAEILGISDRVGSLQVGRDADLVFLSADPFAPHTEVRRVMIGGDIVFQRKASDIQTFRSLRDAGRRSKPVIAIRGGRAVTVTQGPVVDGLILVEDGRITYVGRDRPLPPGATLIEAAGLTIVPGFIDAASHLGFHVEETELARRRPRMSAVPGAASVPPSRWIDAADPVFSAAATAGVTAILLSPENEGPCSLLKLSKDKITVLREVAALKFTAKGGAAGTQALRDTVKRGRKYVDEADAYERAKREAAAVKPPERAADAISGNWKGTVDGGEGGRQDFTAELKLETGKVRGTIKGLFTAGKAEVLEGTFEQNELKLTGSAAGQPFEVLARLQGADHVKGTWKRGEVKGVIEARREPPPAAKAATPLKEPVKDEALEPYRLLFLKEIPALVVARDVPAVDAAVKIFRQEFDVDLIVTGAEESISAAGAVRDRISGVVLGPEFLKEERGARVNVPEALAAQGMLLAFSSGGVSATRKLPLTAAFAVRQGMDPFEVLKALTVGPARLLRMDARMGSIERGRDADLVFWTGDPFSPSSRVRRVMIDGKTVFEAK